MRKMVAKLIDAAADLSSDVMVVVRDEDPKRRDSLVSRIERFLHKIRDNEGLSVFVHKRDDMDKTTILIGVDNHESKDAIVREIWNRAEKEAGKEGIQIWTKELRDKKADAMASELLIASREMLSSGS